jgi:hypothetical protein
MMDDDETTNNEEQPPAPITAQHKKLETWRLLTD